jgi:cyclopropane-fatty-acyl-phospholipid synthase
VPRPDHGSITTNAPGGSTTGGANQQAIERHYDVGHDFYRLWLGPTMVYSCALWTGEPDEDLEDAQIAKLAWHARSAQAHGASRALDVGCGWGAMVRYLATESGVGEVTGLTLSSDQAAVAAEGAPANVEIRLQDWRDHQPKEPYDAIISIGAFEHFARHELSQAERRAVYKSFFDKCRQWLPPGGRLSLQTIGHEDFDPASGTGALFFADIFPESGLPQLSDIVQTAEQHFRLVGFRNDSDHYERTLTVWQQRLEAHKDEAYEMVGRETYRRYVRYLRLSRAMFGRRLSTLYRMVYERRPDGGTDVR